MSRRPRILLYSATPRSDRGGVQRMLDDLEVELPARGLDVTRVGPDETEATGGIRFEARTDAGADGRPALAALPAAAGSAWRLARILRRVRPQVVNMHFVMGEAVYPIALRPVFGHRLVLSAHGGDLMRPTPQMRRHLPRVLRAADAVTVVSRELGAAARRMGGPSLAAPRYIPNGVDVAFWSPGPGAPTAGRVVAAGRLLPIKGFDLLVDAMAGLPDATLTILGEGADRAALAARAAAAGLGGRIDMPGHLPPERMRAAFRDAQVFAMPSRGEGMPLALLEALACGCPAVAAGVGGVPDVLTPDAGSVVPPGDADALRDALAHALSGGARAPTREAARARALAHSKDACYDAYAALLGAEAEAARAARR